MKKKDGRSPSPKKGIKLSPELCAKLSRLRKGKPSPKRGKWDMELAAVDGRKNPKGNGLWLTTLVNNKRQKAKKRNLAWNLTRVEAGKLLIGACDYCGFKGEIDEMGIDRVSNEIRSYDAHNCVSCCKFCNSAKHDQTREQFLEWLARVKGIGK